jgi:opacity protein-like surface antigen
VKPPAEKIGIILEATKSFIGESIDPLIFLINDIMTNLLKTTLTCLAVLIISPTLFAQQDSMGYFKVQPFKGSKQFRKLSVGVNAGVMSPSVVIGGSNDFTNPQSGFGYGANLRYQLTHYFALQADVVRGTLRGNQDKEINGLPPGSRPVESFNTDLHWAGSINAQITFGNVNWLSVKNTIVPYVSAGMGYASYEPTIIYTGTTQEVAYKDDAIQEMFVPVGLGLKINLSKLINLDLGYRMHFVDGDNLDGSPYWTNPAPYSSVTKKDKFSYGFAGIEFALGNKRKPQLLFDNPAYRTNEILQSQVSNLSTRVDSLAAAQKSLTDDTDGDGVPDRFDREPNTPAGSTVDARGVALDTDGDGVPDSRDKQMVTPTECQPVDADGVGKCPDPECCKNMVDSTAMECMADYPSINFSGNSVQLGATARGIISTLSTTLKGKPNCKIILKGYPEASKSSQSVCQRRLDAIKNRLVETEGISADRISTDCSVGGGDKNTVDISSN